MDVGAYSSVCGGEVVNTPECGWRVFGVGICEDSIELHSSKESLLGLDECHPCSFSCHHLKPFRLE